jgi:ATP phosphoribosyltransferase
MTALRLAIPSKGRLKEQMEAYFSDAGIPVQQIGGARGYAAKIDGLAAIDVQLLSASEIAAGVMSGAIHVGVTGEDLLREATPDLDAVAHLILPLGFGRARLVVAAPKSWIDVETMEDVDDVGARLDARTGQTLRVATKYVRQTRRFFADKGVTHYRIVESAGATEGAPAAGAAELVVDITTTGATLEGNGLKIISDGLILDSQAQLVGSLRAPWTPEATMALRALLDVLEARSAGRALTTLRYDAAFDPAVMGKPLSAELEIAGPGEALCRKARSHDFARMIAAAGGGPVRTADASFVYRADNPRYDAFVARLPRVARG